MWVMALATDRRACLEVEVEDGAGGAEQTHEHSGAGGGQPEEDVLAAGPDRLVFGSVRSHSDALFVAQRNAIGIPTHPSPAMTPFGSGISGIWQPSCRVLRRQPAGRPSPTWVCGGLTRRSDATQACLAGGSG